MKSLSRGEHNVPDSKARTEPTPSAFKDFFNRKLSACQRVSTNIGRRATEIHGSNYLDGC